MKAQCIIKDRVGGLQSANVSICIGLDSKMLTNANKGTYFVKKCQKYANVIYERPLTKVSKIHFAQLSTGIFAPRFFLQANFEYFRLSTARNDLNN